jgi:hypothetical protein
VEKPVFQNRNNHLAFVKACVQQGFPAVRQTGTTRVNAVGLWISVSLLESYQQSFRVGLTRPLATALGQQMQLKWPNPETACSVISYHDFYFKLVVVVEPAPGGGHV